MAKPLLLLLFLGLASSTAISKEIDWEKEWQECEQRYATLSKQRVITFLNFCTTVYPKWGPQGNVETWRRVREFGMRSIEVSEWRSRYMMGIYSDSSVAYE